MCQTISLWIRLIILIEFCLLLIDWISVALFEEFVLPEFLVYGPIFEIKDADIVWT